MHLFYKMNTLETIDLTNTSRVPATTGPISFINCNFENISLILRPIDKLLYTYPSSNAPLYVDNATAVATLGVGYWYRDSDNSNKLEVTY